MERLLIEIIAVAKIQLKNRSGFPAGAVLIQGKPGGFPLGVVY